MKNIFLVPFQDVEWRGNVYITLFLRLLIVLFLYGLCRIGFYFFNYEFFSDISPLHLLYLMYGGLRFDISAILYINSLYILLYILPFNYRFNATFQRITKYWFVITNAIGLSANVADFIYYKFTLRRTTADVFRQFENEQNLPSLFMAFLFDYWYAVLFLVLLVIILIWLYKQLTIAGPMVRKKMYYYGGGVLCMLVITYLVVVGMRGAFGQSMRPITISNAGEYVNDPKEISIVVNTPFAIFRTLGKTDIQKVDYYSQEELARVYTPIHRPIQDTISFNYNNVVVIILESFSREFMGYFNREKDNGQYKGYTPFLDSLIQHSKTFQYSFANGRKSIDGLPSVVSSIPSIAVPFFLSPHFGNKISSLASVLKTKGYHSSFFHGAPNGSMGFSSFMNVAGFDAYFGMTEYNNDKDYDGHWGIWDEPFFSFFADETNNFKEPFITSIFSVSSHHPFRIPDKYAGKFDEGTQPIHKCIQYTDHALKEYFKKISTMPWYQNTLFVITADHCSSNFHFEDAHTAIGLFSVPVIYFKPDNSLASLDSTISQQIDIMPSVLGYLGYENEYFAFGRDIFREKTEPFAFNYRENVHQLIQDSFILMYDGKQSVGFYDFKKDHLLKNNLVKDNLPEMNTLETKIKAIIQQYNNRMVQDRLTIETDNQLTLTK